MALSICINSIVFLVSTILAGYLGFSLIKVKHDKFLHFITFFILTIEFYFLFDTNNKSFKTLRLITLVCTLVAGVSLEMIQSMINAERAFDINDIFCNIGGSLFALLSVSLYHHYRVKELKKQRGLAKANYMDSADVIEPSLAGEDYNEDLEMHAVSNSE